MLNLDHTLVLAAFLAVGTAASLWQAREENMYNNRRGALRWLAGGLTCGAACCAVVLAIVLAPASMQRQAPNGFGPGWSCGQTAKTASICFRDPVKPQ